MDHQSTHFTTFALLVAITFLCFPFPGSHAARISRELVEGSSSRQMFAVVMHQTTGTWCIAKSGVSDSDLQNALDWACGQETNQGNVDCTAISSGGQCYTPDTLQAHCSYAFNSYFQKNNQAADACNFNGCAQTTNSDPSPSSSCTFSSSTTSSSLNISSSPPSFNTATSSSSGGTLSQAGPDFLSIILCGVLAIAASRKL